MQSPICPSARADARQRHEAIDLRSNSAPPSVPIQPFRPPPLLARGTEPHNALEICASGPVRGAVANRPLGRGPWVTQGARAERRIPPTYAVAHIRK